MDRRASMTTKLKLSHPKARTHQKTVEGLIHFFQSWVPSLFSHFVMPSLVLVLRCS